jgi:sulfatase modifying factor 1
MSGNYAALRNGSSNTRYSWGDELIEDGRFQANVWKGKFPQQNTGDDGWLYTAPVGLFGKTGHGLSDMGGNVWQWMQNGNAGKNNLAGADERLLKGGSFMCDSSFCHNYQIKGRTFSSRETALFHTGFRCAKSL